MNKPAFHVAVIGYTVNLNGEFEARTHEQDVTDSVREGADAEDLLENIGARLSAAPGFVEFTRGNVEERVA